MPSSEVFMLIDDAQTRGRESGLRLALPCLQTCPADVAARRLLLESLIMDGLRVGTC